MSVNVPSPQAYYAQIGQHLVLLRQAIDLLQQDAAYLNAMGGAAFLEGPPFNALPSDATLIATQIGAVTSANSTVQAIEAFLASTVALTGGV